MTLEVMLLGPLVANMPLTKPHILQSFPSTTSFRTYFLLKYTDKTLQQRIQWRMEQENDAKALLTAPLRLVLLHCCLART